MAESKIASYFGFARRAGKLTCGVNAVNVLKKDAFLLIADRSASENTKKEIDKIARRLGSPLVWTDDLETLAGKEHCKIVAVRDEHLAAAIRSEAEGTD